MGVKFILSQIAAKVGLNPSVEGHRLVMLRWLNEAALELYEQADVAGTLCEGVFKMNGNQTISLPMYVGYIRAIREYNSHIPWNINQMRPRYNQFAWKDSWRNIRLLNRQPLMASITNQAEVVVNTSIVENPPVVVTITGQTNLASSISEDVTLNTLSVTTTNQFVNITSVIKNKVNTCDIILNDIDGKLLTLIPNNEVEALYQVIDVSSAPWIQQSLGNMDHYVEILYKKALAVLFNDGDEYPIPDHDYILVNKVLQLWSEEQGKADAAIAYDSKATRSLARKHEENNRATQDMIALVANPHDYLLPRLRGRRYGRYGGYWNTRQFFS